MQVPTPVNISYLETGTSQNIKSLININSTYVLLCKHDITFVDILMEVGRKEKELGIVPDPDIDTYMKVTI